MAAERRTSALLPGTLDLLVLRTLQLGPLHGHGIVKHIERASDEVLLVDHGSLYPALRRLERQGFLSSSWEPTPRGREMRFYRLTAKGKRQLAAEEDRWALVAGAMAKILST
jgi:transcriptional regulator